MNEITLELTDRSDALFPEYYRCPRCGEVAPPHRFMHPAGDYYVHAACGRCWAAVRFPERAATDSRPDA